MEGNCNYAYALNDAQPCVLMAANISGGVSEHATSTKSRPSLSRPIRAFFNGSIPSRIKLKMRRWWGNATRVIFSRIKRMLMQRRSGNATTVVSSRIERLMQRKGEYARAVDFEIEASKIHWSQLHPTSDDQDETKTDFEAFESLREKWGGFFQDLGDRLVMGEKIAEGGQAEIFNAEWTFRDGSKECVLKVFKEGWALRDLQKQWPHGMLQNSMGVAYYTASCALILGGTMLKNGRFAFRIDKYSGDLRKLIDVRMLHNHNKSPLFTHGAAEHIISSIAEGMRALHEHNIIHRDLKAFNLLVWNLYKKEFDPINDDFVCEVEDFECSVGVVGTGYWRAPEIFQAVHSRDIKPDLFSEKSDVYSYAMTCYEVLTGCIPFEDLGGNCYDIVLKGKRPKLPNHVNPMLKTLLEGCWHTNPLERPSFKGIMDYLRKPSPGLEMW